MGSVIKIHRGCMTADYRLKSLSFRTCMGNVGIMVGLLLPLCAIFIPSTSALRLTFPPARDWNDFIDNQNSEAPFGAHHSATSPITVLSAGNSLNVTWSLSDASEGSVRVELLRPVGSGDGANHNRIAESTLLEIRASNGSLVSQYHVAVLTNGSTAQWAMVDLPAEDCSGCTIRVLRQASDFQQGSDHSLLSCADVNIATVGVNQCHGCSNNKASCGKNEMSGLYECKCDISLPFSGTYCECEDECVVDLDCGPSNAKCIDIHSTNSPSRQCFCKSGWSGERCQVSSDLDLSDKVDLATWRTNYQQNYTSPSADFIMFWKVVEAPVDESMGKRQIEIALAAKTESYVAVGWRPSIGIGYQPLSDSQPSTIPLPPPEVEVQAPLSNAPSMSASRAQDMTIATARGNFYRVKDAWSLAGLYSTPVLDTLLGGVDDITDANGHEEENGWSYFVFRRPLLPSDQNFDHPLIEGQASTVVWAKGQTANDANADSEATSSVESKLEESKFYGADEIVYHGRRNARVIEDIDLVATATPIPSLSHYKFHKYIPGTKIALYWKINLTSVDLAVVGSTRGWLSIGFSNSRESPLGSTKDALVVVGSPDAKNPTINGSVKVYKMLNNTSAGMAPVLDASNPVREAVVAILNGSTVLRFVAELTSVDGANFMMENSSRLAYLVWAESPDNSIKLQNHFLGHRGAISIDFDTGDIKVLISDPTHWYQLHGIFMWASFGVIIPISFISGRYLTPNHQQTYVPYGILKLAVVTAPHIQHLHHTSHFLAIVISFGLTIAATIIAFSISVGGPWQPLHRPHGLVGFVTLFILFISAVNGAMCRPVDHGSFARRIWARTHWVLGVGLVLCATCAAIMGIQRYHEMTGEAVIVLWVVYGGCLSVPLLVWFALQFVKSHEKIHGLASKIHDDVATYNKRIVARGSWPPENMNWPMFGGRGTSTSLSNSSTPTHRRGIDGDAHTTFNNDDYPSSESDTTILPNS